MENEEQKKTQSEAAAQSQNMISFRINGGKQLHILDQPKRSIPRVYEGDILSFEIDYPNKLLLWSVNGEEVVRLEKIPFEQSANWYPFLTMKHRDDSVELLG